jgi:hypothetical protein
VSLALGGKAGSRLAVALGLRTSQSALLRLVHRLPLSPLAPVRVLVVEDWAWRKGRRWGTILCDLERGKVVDLLPGRSAGGLAHWLGEHPGVEVVSRDRGGA